MKETILSNKINLAFSGKYSKFSPSCIYPKRKAMWKVSTKSLAAFFSFFIFACHSNADEKAASQTYKLAVNPTASLNPDSTSTYRYDIVNETNLETEVDGKDVESINRSTIGLNYSIRKDSAGNLMIDLVYDKVTLYTRSGDVEKNLNSDNAQTSIDPLEKLLGALKASKIRAVLTPKGETKELSGYKELGEKLMAGFNASDSYGRALAQKQWENTVKQQLVDNNLEQIFRIFPDSLVRVGDQWKTESKHNEQIPLNLRNTYTLEAIEDSVAILSVKGEVKAKKEGANIAGAPVAADLNGSVKGTYKINIKTGMPLRSEVQSKTGGKLFAMGREVPVTIKNKITISAHPRL